MKTKSLYLTHIISLLLVLFFSLPSQALDKDGLIKKILCISSFGSENLYVQEELLSFVRDAGRDDTSFMPIFELMNCRSLNNISAWQESMQEILTRHKNPDIVVLLGNEAAITYFSMPEEQYRKIPVYVLQCNNSLACLATPYGIPSVQTEKRGSIRDIKEIMKGFNVRYAELKDYDVVANIELIQRLYGHTHNIAVLTDNSYTGLCMQYEVKKVEERFPKFKFHYLDGRNLDMEQALERVRRLPSRTILLLGGWEIDKNESTYLSNAVYAFKNARSNVLLPVFSFSGAGIGYWPIGGYMPWEPTEREHLSEFFHKDLETGMSQKAEIHILPKTFVFDETVLESMEISKEEVPENSIFLNGKMSGKDFVREYKWYAILGLSLIALLAIIALTAVAYSIRISRLRKTLQASEEQLRKEKEELQKSEYKLRIAKERAEEAERAKSLFISNISHEIRTPLNSIVGFAQVMTEMMKEQPEVAEFARIIQNDSEKLSKLIDGLLEVSDIQSGNKRINKERVNIISFIASMVDNMKQSMKEGVTLSFTSPYPAMDMDTDINRLIQVLMNLIQYSMRNTDKGYIIVAVEKDPANTMAQISVTDTGQVLPKEVQKVLFNRFEKKEEFIQGANMELTICQTIIESLGGNIWLDESYEGGTRFVFSHPL